MNGVHDMGGLQCFGPVDPDPDDPLFHAPWERQALALTLAVGASGTWNLDESRFARESLPPDVYLSAGYYKIWLLSLEKLLLKHALVTRQELAEGKALTPASEIKRRLLAEDVPAALAAGSPVTRPAKAAARFKPGESITVSNRHPSTHTRLPAYIRGHTGTIRAVHGCHVFPDSHAIGLGEDPQWLYNVSFSATELWGTPNPQLDQVHVDCWEPYLEVV